MQAKRPKTTTPRRRKDAARETQAATQIKRPKFQET